MSTSLGDASNSADNVPDARSSDSSLEGASSDGSQFSEDWTLEITPRSDLLHIPLADIWRYRDLLWMFVKRDFVSFYKQTILGPLWFFIQPIFMTLVFTLVFGQIGELAPKGVVQILFYLCGVTFWNYFADCLNKTAMTFKDNAKLFGKVYFPRLIVPISIVLSNLIKFGVQFLLFGCFFSWYYFVGVPEDCEPLAFPWQALWVFPTVVAIMGVLGLGLGMIFSSMTTKYRDLVFLLQFGVQLLMYGSAVIFSWDVLLSKYPAAAPVLAWNPLIPLIESVRSAFLGTTSQFGSAGIAYSATCAAVIFVVACLVFNRVEKTFMDTV